MGYDYEFKHLDDLTTRLSQAGVRIAAHLNDVFQTQ
jgi:hypothetical protein